MVRDGLRGKYRHTRLFVLTLGYSRKLVRLLVLRSSSKTWAELHEQAFQRLGGVPPWSPMHSHSDCDNLLKVLQRGNRVDVIHRHWCKGRKIERRLQRAKARRHCTAAAAALVAT